MRARLNTFSTPASARRSASTSAVERLIPEQKMIPAVQVFQHRSVVSARGPHAHRQESSEVPSLASLTTSCSAQLQEGLRHDIPQNANLLMLSTLTRLEARSSPITLRHLRQCHSHTTRQDGAVLHLDSRQAVRLSLQSNQKNPCSLKSWLLVVILTSTWQDTVEQLC